MSCEARKTTASKNYQHVTTFTTDWWERASRHEVFAAFYSLVEKVAQRGQHGALYFQMRQKTSFLALSWGPLLVRSEFWRNLVCIFDQHRWSSAFPLFETVAVEVRVVRCESNWPPICEYEKPKNENKNKRRVDLRPLTLERISGNELPDNGMKTSLASISHFQLYSEVYPM